MLPLSVWGLDAYIWPDERKMLKPYLVLFVYNEVMLSSICMKIGSLNPAFPTKYVWKNAWFHVILCSIHQDWMPKSKLFKELFWEKFVAVSMCAIASSFYIWFGSLDSTFSKKLEKIIFGFFCISSLNLISFHPYEDWKLRFNLFKRKLRKNYVKILSMHSVFKLILELRYVRSNIP
jgi:hypothetical protein